MADAVTTQTFNAGDRNLIMSFTNLSDGTGESAVKKVDASDNGVTELRIDRIVANVSGMAVSILWDADTDVRAFIIGQDTSGEFDFRPFGGLKNNAGTGKTGDINFTTHGHTSGDSYSIILYMSKL